MGHRRQSQKDRCQKCRLHISYCICNQLQTVESKIKMIVLRHHREEVLSSNSINWLKLLIPTVEIMPYGELEGENPINLLIANKSLETKYYMLFPHEEARNIKNIDWQPQDSLIIPDGSWRQARKIKNRLFQKMPEIIPVSFTPRNPSEYILRKSAQIENLSTFEAVVHFLSYLEGEENYLKRMNYFRLFVHQNRVARAQISQKQNKTYKVEIAPLAIPS